jgi:hypothetical protein
LLFRPNAEYLRERRRYSVTVFCDWQNKHIVKYAVKRR